jgi:hypothetical protein
LYCHEQKIAGKGFPLMKQYIKDIERSLPTLLKVGSIGIFEKDLEAVYNKVKQLGYFGETQDC